MPSEHTYKAFDLDIDTLRGSVTTMGGLVERQFVRSVDAVRYGDLRRVMMVREFEQPAELSVHHLLAELYDGVDWVLVEGFKESDLQKIEVWRASTGQAPRYMDDDFIVAIATDSPDQLPQATVRPVFNLNDPGSVASWLVANQDRFDYKAELYR